MTSDKRRVIYLAQTRGFCAGVRRAIDTVDECLTVYGAPVYVLHAIVHNRHVVEDFENRGAVFVESLSDVPVGRPLIFSAHGVSKAVEEEACRRGIGPVIDATCPLVKRVHSQVSSHCAGGETVVLIGHHDHPEILGTLGQVPDRKIYVVSGPDEVADLPLSLDAMQIVCVAQTTLTKRTVDAAVTVLAKRFPRATVTTGATVCYASSNRQAAVHEVTLKADMVLIVGSANSSNARRLRETAESQERKAYLIDSHSDVREEWLEGISSVGISAGASTPEHLVTELLADLERMGWREVVLVGEPEDAVEFRRPLVRTPKGELNQ